MQPSRPMSVERLVERQMNFWNTQRRERPRETPARVESDLAPYIAISRQVGSCGNEIGAALAEQLGYDYYDREIVDYIAERANVRVAAVKSLGETWHNAVHDWISGTLDRNYLGCDMYVRHLVQVVTALAGHGPAVFMGRGAGYILPPERGLRVRIVAPEANRITYAVAHYSLSETDARKLIVTSDASQDSFKRTYFKVAGNDPLIHDLTINTGSVSLTEAVETCLALHRARLAGPVTKAAPAAQPVPDATPEVPAEV